MEKLEKRKLWDSLRTYQRTAVNVMTTMPGALEYDDMGLGKTVTTLTTVGFNDAFPCLIICPKFAFAVWQEEIAKWLNLDSVLYTGKPKEREKCWAEFINSGCKCLITNYAMLEEIALRSGVKLRSTRTSIKEPGNFKWGAIIWDEAHMGGLFNHKSKSYKVSLKLAKLIPYRYVLTGTPFRQGCVDFYGPLSLVDYHRFDSYWKFVNRYCVITETMFGKEIERTPKDIPAFRSMIRQYMIRRVKDEVLTELPGKQRQPLFVEMNKEQQKLYNELTNELMAFVPESDDIIITPNQLSLITRQRQILACPQELGLKNRGAGIDIIMEHSHLKLDEGEPVVVFTPFRTAIDHLERAFKEEYPGIHVYKIQGKMTAQEFGDAWQGFQKDPCKLKVLLCVIKSSASFHATVADTAYFLGYEWDFNLNEQAEDRLNRMGQKNFVNVYYVMHKGTVDDNVAGKLNDKKWASNWVVGTDKQYLSMLKKVQNRK